MNEILEETLKRIDRICSWGNDGREHTTWLNKKECYELKKYINSLKTQLSATEEVAIEWQRKYQEATGTLDVEYLDDLEG